MAYGAITCLQENLQKLLDDEINLKLGVEAEVDQLHEDLHFLKAFLEREINGEASTQFEREIREVIYNADDAVNAFFTTQRSSLFQLKRPNVVKTLRTFREKVLRPILDRARKATIAQPMIQQQRTPLLREDNIVSFEDEERNKETEELDPISITGTPDLGKTTLASSFDELPHDLRDCFLYLGMFPEHTEISAWELTRLWIAEGFIRRKPGKSYEATAEENLKDLIHRNLVAVGKNKVEGGIKTCRVSIIVREFCMSRAKFEEQNLFQEVKRSRGVFHPSVSQILKCRRIRTDSNDVVQHFPWQTLKGAMVRTLLCFAEECCNKPIPEALSLLRVLDVHVVVVDPFIKFTRLMHIRYICLTGDHVDSLPEAISKLRNLNTVRINTTSRTLEIRADLWKMKNLEHFKTKAAIVINKEAKGNMGENLQTLSRLSAQCVTDEFCWRGLNLKKLGIRGRLGLLLETNCLARLDHLEKMKLIHDVYPKPESQDPLLRLPCRESFPPNLMILELSSTFLEWKHMATLAMLPALEVLKLKENAFVGKVWNVVGGGFPYLEVLLVATIDLEIWTASGNPFPKLGRLVLKNCRRLEEIPSAVVESVQVLEIERVKKSVVESAWRIEKEKKQMQDQGRGESGGFKLIIGLGDGR